MQQPTVPQQVVQHIKQGHNEALAAYLDNGLGHSNVNYAVEGCTYGETLLHYAAWHGNAEAVAMLVRRGARIDAKGVQSDCTPLHSAAAGGHLGVVALLLSLGARLNSFTQAGWSPMHSCALRGYENVAWYLEKQGLSLDDRTAEGRSARDMLNHALAEKKHKTATPTSGLSVQDLLDESSNLRIQIASDTHVEFYESFSEIPELITPSAPILGLLGDIGNPALPTYRDFLYHQATRFKLVLVLAGNHEYYSPSSAPPHPTMGELNQAIYDICAAAPRKNIVYLDKGLVELGEFVIMGCILWSDIPEDMKQQAASSMNDYRLIYKTRRHLNFPEAVFSPDDSVAAHKDQLQWLQTQIQASMSKGKKAVVLTHHTPTYRIRGSGLAFSSSLEYMFKNKGTNVAVWAHGHTHYNDDKIIEGTRVVSNMVGYKHGKQSDYQPDLVITVAK